MIPPCPPLRLPRPQRSAVPAWTLACTLLFAGCGDVRGEDVQGVARVPALTVDGRGSSYLAYQDGSGAWQALSTQLSEAAPQKLSLTDPQGRYGVMNLCLDDASGNLSVNVQHGTLAETPVVTASCATGAAREASVVGVSGLVRGLEPGEYGNVYLGGASALVDSAVPRHRLELPPARYDLIATKYAPDKRVPSRLVFEPGLVVGGATTTADVDFGGPYAFTPEAGILRLAGLRRGELLSGSVAVVTETGTAALLGEYQGGSVLPYARPPAVVLRGAQLRAEVQSFSYDGRTKAGSSRSLTRTFAGDTTPLLRLPPPLAAPLLRLLGEAPLRVAARWRAYPGAAGTYTQFYSQIREGRSVSYRLSQTSAWFAGRPLSYTLPDFSALPEWREAWGLERGEAVFWDVSFRRETQNATLFASRSGVLTP